MYYKKYIFKNLRIVELAKMQLDLKKEIQKLFILEKYKKTIINRKKLKIVILLFLVLPIFSQKQVFSEKGISRNQVITKNIIWKKTNLGEKNEKDIIWQRIKKNKDSKIEIKEIIKNQYFSNNNNEGISSFNRSIVFNNSIVGPDVSWLVPPGFKWNNKYKFDTSIKGHSGRFDKGRKGKSFWALEDGDAVGQFYYQFLNYEKTSFGLNYGIRSIYSGSGPGGTTPVGEGQSLGFRLDRKISSTEGFSFGAEQLLHFDGLTDTGRDIYFTLSKAFWSNDKTGQFPLDIYTIGVGTGRMAEGNIKFLCSDLFGGSGTEVYHQRRLCWAPVFSVSRVFNKKLSTFFEYNSKWFVLGSSIIPFNEIPLRGTFAVQLSDHIDNYKLNNFDEIKYVFRLSLGF